jgi:hypothetical protein
VQGRGLRGGIVFVSHGVAKICARRVHVALRGQQFRVSRNLTHRFEVAATSP